MNMKETIRTMSTLLLMTVAMVIFACTFTCLLYTSDAADEL